MRLGIFNDDLKAEVTQTGDEKIPVSDRGHTSALEPGTQRSLIKVLKTGKERGLIVIQECTPRLAIPEVIPTCREAIDQKIAKISESRPVGGAKGVGGGGGVVILDGEVTGQIEDGRKIELVKIGPDKLRFRDGNVIVIAFQKTFRSAFPFALQRVHEERDMANPRPELSVHATAFREFLGNDQGVVNHFGIMRKTVTAIPLAKGFPIIAVGHPRFLGACAKAFIEVGRQFVFCVTEKRGDLGGKSKVYEGRKVEERGALGGTGQHQEADIIETTLDFPIENSQLVADSRSLGGIFHHTADRGIVFIDKNNDRLAGASRERTNGVNDIGPRCGLGIIVEFLLAKSPPHGLTKPLFKCFRRIRRYGKEVETQNGILHPIIVHLVDGQTLEKVTTPLKEGLQRRKHHRFAETTWTGEKETFVVRVTDERIQHRRLVHVKRTFSAYSAEIIGIQCDWLHLHLLLPYSIT